MKKAVLTLAAVLAGCSLQANSPEARHVEAQPSAAQPSLFSHQPENYALINCNYKLTMDTWGYTITCDDGSEKITLDHSEWADGRNNRQCDERLYYEDEKEKAKWIDYGCDGLEAYLHWTVVETPTHSYDNWDVTENPASAYQQDSFGLIKVLIGADKADARWRFRYHIPARGAL